MSAALQRLVARATGALADGLRPHLASRFETGIREAGLQETHAEVPVRSAPPPTPVPAEPPHALGPRRVAAVAEPPPAGPNPAPPASAGPRAERHVTANASMPERQATLPREPLDAAAPASLLQKAPAATERPQAPVAAGAVADGEDRAPARVPVPPRAAPRPLLTLDPAPRIREVPFAVPVDRPAARAAPQQADHAPEPEITIRIGRIDVHAGAPRQAGAPPSSVGPRPLPALSDYLRGSRS